MNISTAGQRLEHLCDVELENQQGTKPVITRKAKLGEYLVSGEGAVFGPSLNGFVQWTLSQENLDEPCGFTLLGEITTEDSASIHFDTLGFIKRGIGGDPSKYQLTGSLFFQTGSVKYAWLNELLGVWQGIYDMGTFRHSYRIFVQRFA